MAPTMVRRLILIAVLGLAACGDKNSNDAGDPGDADGADAPDADGGDSDATDVDAGVCPTFICGGECCADGLECVQDSCVAACATGVRCGADELTCCGGGDVCISNSCVTPGIACTDAWDCADGEFCEPTLNQCVVLPEEPFCMIPPDNSFDPDEEWHWAGYADTTGPDTATYANVVATPIVADLDLDGVPEVIFFAYPGASLNAARLFVIDGSTGMTKHALPLATIASRGVASAAVGNLDADPELEIAGYATSGTARGVFIVDNLNTTPTVKCNVNTTAMNNSNATLAIANVNASPAPEIILGGIVVDASCTVLFDASAGTGLGTAATAPPALIGCNSNGCLNGIADLDGEPDQDGAGNTLPELVGGAVAYRFNKSTSKWDVYWDRRADATLNRDGFVAVGEIDASHAGPEVVVVANGNVFVRDGRTGVVIPFDTGVNSAAIGGLGGPPTIGDFDGDGRAEFASAGSAAYLVYDMDCDATRDPLYCTAPGTTTGVLWSKVTQDLSSSNTGSSVFDFQGDGAAEVIYNDECYLRVYDGSTGNVLLETENSSRTGIEYPIVVDVDGDKRSEFLVVANNDQIARDNCPYCVAGQPCGYQGVRAFGDPANKWMKTRRIWNQHTYHITNVGQDGTIPVTEVDNFTTPGLNNYRMNAQGAGAFNAPDLTISSVAVDVTTCPDLKVQARVTNFGSIGVPAGIPIDFYRGTSGTGTPFATGMTTIALLPGASELVTVPYAVPSGDNGPYEFFAAIGAGAPVECQTNNNGTGSSPTQCDIVGKR